MSRMDKINSQMRKEIGSVIQLEMSDPRIQFVSITKVDVSPDLRNARVYFSVLGDTQSIEHAQMGLDGAKGLIRRHIAKRMDLRSTPALAFIYDKSIENSARIEQALQELKNNEENNTSA